MGKETKLLPGGEMGELLLRKGALQEGSSRRCLAWR